MTTADLLGYGNAGGTIFDEQPLYASSLARKGHPFDQSPLPPPTRLLCCVSLRRIADLLNLVLSAWRGVAMQLQVLLPSIDQDNSSAPILRMF